MTPPDDIDRAQELDLRYREAALARRRTERPAAPSTGVCLSCGHPIEAERLAAVPDADRCIDCQTEEEERG